jgi:hypothetical protein
VPRIPNVDAQMLSKTVTPCVEVFPNIRDAKILFGCLHKKSSPKKYSANFLGKPL